jgi:enoyl-[acyl-carrier protein] reductase II
MNAIRSLFNIKYPIIQAGMVWCSGWRLASAVSNAGGLGLIGAGSMSPDVLREHIKKCSLATSNPFGVNVPLLYRDVDQVFEILVEQGVKIVFTSAGDPSKWTSYLKGYGIKVVHVIANKKFALKAEQSGADALVAEGFEAGGHNGREETTTLCLVPEICEAVSIPVIAAGGIGCGKAMLAAFALGADAVQVGSLFAASIESSAHENFKNAIINAVEGDTKLSMKSLIPVRLMKNEFFQKVEKAESEGATRSDLMELLGKGRARQGMFEGDLAGGELEIGQIASSIHEIKSASVILNEVWQEFIAEKMRICKLSF